MSSKFYNILIHHKLIPLIQESNNYFQEELQKCLNKLQMGYWGGGTRVKVLKGVKKAVYEARVNRDLRLLFTVSSSHSPYPPYDLERFVMAWDLVDHDHIDRARRMNIEPETSFLDFEEMDSHELDESPEAPGKELAEEEAIFDLISSPDNTSELKEEILDSIRWFRIDPEIIDDEKEWQELFEQSIEDLELKLSREQAKAVNSKGPALVRGSAGSGKTTVTVYRLAKALQENPTAKVLYVTYSKALLKTVQQLFTDLFKARRLDLPVNMPEFLTFPELYQKITRINVESNKIIRYPAFDEWYSMIYRNGNSALAWEEIRGIIKGACLDLDRQELTKQEYEELGKKRAPLFIQERPEIYKIFTSYQSSFNKDQNYDDLDLAREALKRLETQKNFQYDNIVCDEGQDLTELELSLLMQLCRQKTGLFFAADPQQIVNPSGFRWAELKMQLKDKLQGQSLPAIQSLTRNYRSVESIVKLANTLISLKRNKTGRSDDDELQQATLKGSTPLLINAPENEIIQAVKDFGPRCAVITGTAKQAKKISKLLASERVFDIASSKGLEFHSCLLWDVLDKDLSIWKELLDDDSKLKENAQARRAISYAYVAVTRAQKNLAVYESHEQARKCWQDPQFSEAMEEENAQALSKFMTTPGSVEEWLKEGHYYLDRDRFLQAAECFRRSGNLDLEKKAIALQNYSLKHYAEASALFLEISEWKMAGLCYLHDNDFQEAAKLFQQDQEWLLAAEAYIKDKDFKNAAEAYLRKGKIVEHRECQLEHFRSEKKWVEAAKVCLKMKNIDRAIYYYQKAGDKTRAFDLTITSLKAAEKYSDAGELLKKKKLWKQAAEVYALDGSKRDQAACLAELNEQQGKYLEAATQWQEADNYERELQAKARYFQQHKKWLKAADLHLELHDEKMYVKCLRKSQEPEAEKLLEALYYKHNGEFLTSILIYEELEYYDQAVELADYIIDHKAHELEEEDLHDLEEVFTRQAIRHAIANKDIESVKELAADCKHDFSLYLIADCLEEFGDFTLAAEYHKKNDSFEEVLWCYDMLEERPDDYDKIKKIVEERFTRVKETPATWQEKGLSKKMFELKAQDYEKQGDYQSAAEAYEAIGLFQDANRCRTKS